LVFPVNYFLLAFPPISYMHFSSPKFMLHALPTSSSLTWSFAIRNLGLTIAAYYRKIVNNSYISKLTCLQRETLKTNLAPLIYFEKFIWFLKKSDKLHFRDCISLIVTWFLLHANDLVSVPWFPCPEVASVHTTSGILCALISGQTLHSTKGQRH
jgi:hypothetical protein